MLCTGVDLIEIERVQAAITRYGQRFLSRVYTAGERQCCGRVAGCPFCGQRSRRQSVGHRHLAQRRRLDRH